MNKNALDQIIEDTFTHEPGFRLPDDFAQKVTARLKRRSQWKSDLSDYLNINAVVILILTFVGGTYYFINRTIVIQAITFISNNILAVGSLLLILNFILFADRVILPLLFNRWKINEWVRKRILKIDFKWND